MASCTYEPWTMKDLTDALKCMHKERKEIVVPMFQRGKRWKINQEKAFIDSLKNSYPVGTMLFYRTVENEKEIYTLVDGLQRGNTIKKYMSEPTKYFSAETLPEKLVNDIFIILDINGQENVIKNIIADTIVGYIQSLDSLENIQFYNMAKEITNKVATLNLSANDLIIDVIGPFLIDYKKSYEKISNTVIPVIVYTGEESSLPEIFDRINSKGTPLTTYEVYAASWPNNKKYKINNSDIVDKILKKYDSLADDDFTVSGYDRETIRKEKELNAFEYVFGFSKYINLKYDFLNFDKSSPNDAINPMGFELINACINDSNNAIKNLYKDLESIDINLFEKCLTEAIEFVGKIIAKITKFKGNNNGKGQNIILHSKYQILSMISSAFREKYYLSNLKETKKTWNNSKLLLEKNMIQHYVYDIITSEWSDGGTSKIHTAVRPNKYLNPISKNAWEGALNAWFEKNNIRLEKKNVSNPKKEDIVLLNCIYLPIFSAMDQLSMENFDIEHIATKEQTKKLIDICKGSGLPISSIGNLCYLPQKVNRSKGEKTFYQDVKYLKHIDLMEVETKYSFTKKHDLEWMDMPYTKDDFEFLKENYIQFISNRFLKQKEMFYNSLNII